MTMLGKRAAIPDLKRKTNQPLLMSKTDFGGESDQKFSLQSPTTATWTEKERILELCWEHDISVNKLSSMSSVMQSTVNNIVSGRNNSATVSTVKKLWVLPLKRFLLV